MQTSRKSHPSAFVQLYVTSVCEIPAAVPAEVADAQAVPDSAVGLDAQEPIAVSALSMDCDDDDVVDPTV